MPGWIIQGVRGEGKSLAAVHMIRKYMMQGRVVATNLDLYLENLLPPDNTTIAYRLPDHPRLCDFELLPPAYDVKYKGEDKNGLLVLDELGTWLNSRSWNDKTRLKLLNWLFLSRKNHWDLILLAQDHEMIDSQVRTTLCDYLVQASRLDRQKIPYLGNVLKWLGLSPYMPRIHRYHVFYGLSTQQKPVETWTVRGTDIYDGYDTNQRFRDGFEAMCGTLVDMRATYSYLPCCYVTRHIFIDRLQAQIDQLKQPNQPTAMATKKTSLNQNDYIKPFLMLGLLLIFLGWKYFNGAFDFKKPEPVLTSTTSTNVLPVSRPITTPISNQPVTPVPTADDTYKAITLNDALNYLLKTYRPRLSIMASSPELGLIGNIDFYDGDQLTETYSIKELHALGASIVKKPYGADILYAGKAFVVTSWPLPKQMIEPVLTNSAGSSDDVALADKDIQPTLSK